MSFWTNPFGLNGDATDYGRSQAGIDNAHQDYLNSQAGIRNQAANMNMEYPAYHPIYTPDMALTPDIQKMLDGIRTDKTGINKFRTEATRTGPSTWSQLASAQQEAEGANQAEKLTKKNASGVATARGNLAMRGGLSGGAAERIATEGNNEGLRQTQDVGRNVALNKMQISQNDEQNRINQLAMLPGLETTANQGDFEKLKLYGQAKQFDVGNLLGENQNLNAYNMGLYNTGMRGRAAERNAQATENSGGSWLCTEAGNFANQYDRHLLRKLRIYSYRKNKDLTKFYVYGCKPLLDKMKEQGADWVGNQRFVNRVVRLVIDGKMDEAFNHYVEVVDGLLKKYWPDCPHPAIKQLRGVN